MLKRLKIRLFGLTKTELRLLNTDVVIALWGIRNDKKQLEYAKKAIWILEVED